MSTEMTKGPKRTYRKSRRAELEEETRRRITEATVGLHGSVGPARTTVSAIAERAGVQRATVYRHFPDEPALFAACSAHWSAANPMPDLAAWAAIDDPARRLRLALGELYEWFDGTEYMIEKITRDLPVVPSMAEPMAAFASWFEAAADVLMAGRRARGARARRTRAAIGHAVAFETWRSLVRREGLGADEAADLIAAAVAAA